MIVMPSPAVLEPCPSNVPDPAQKGPTPSMQPPDHTSCLATVQRIERQFIVLYAPEVFEWFVGHQILAREIAVARSC